MTYPARVRFRPECLHDYNVLEGLLHPTVRERVTLTNPEPAPDSSDSFHKLGEMVWEVELASAEDLLILMDAMLRVPDGHRMLQTIDQADSFTGEGYEGREDRSARILELLGDHADRLAHPYMRRLGLSVPAPSLNF
jgi:hypothetical protein